jgi:hypothetical protein
LCDISSIKGIWSKAFDIVNDKHILEKITTDKTIRSAKSGEDVEMILKNIV